VKAFDNMYFFGQTEYSVWAITTSEGIIVIDTIFDYSVEEEVDGGMKKMGLDPSKIKYAVVTHPHPDHHGGAKVPPGEIRHQGPDVCRRLGRSRAH
jgi:metallo-beta-lactamase class B